MTGGQSDKGDLSFCGMKPQDLIRSLSSHRKTFKKTVSLLKNAGHESSQFLPQNLSKGSIALTDDISGRIMGYASDSIFISWMEFS
jgi:hypothetical protein